MKVSELLDYLKENFVTVKVTTGNTGSKIHFLKHNESGKKAVLKVYNEKNDIYSFLKNISFENLPLIYDVYELDDGFAVLEEYIDGITVSDVIETGLYSYKGAKRIISDVCDALSILHENGFVHRDIKPENIMISKSSTVKLIDFNVSRKQKENIRHDTQILGTVGYAPPEQFGISQTGSKADIYAIGVLLNVMLTGKHPSEVLAKGKAGKIVLKCTQIDPNKRYPSVKKLKSAL